MASSKKEFFTTDKHGLKMIKTDKISEYQMRIRVYLRVNIPRFIRF